MSHPEDQPVRHFHRISDLVPRLTPQEQRQALFMTVYDELKQRAAAYLANENASHTLQPTALIHEAFLRLNEQTRAEFTDEGHYLAVAAITMRRVLVDHARGKQRDKRGGGMRPVSLDDGFEVGAHKAPRELDVLALDDALNDLKAISERQVRIVEMRFFGGMSVPQVAKALDVSVGTVEADWRAAREWLKARLG